jgi:hypothetical protein
MVELLLESVDFVSVSEAVSEGLLLQATKDAANATARVSFIKCIRIIVSMRDVYQKATRQAKALSVRG